MLTSNDYYVLVLKYYRVLLTSLLVKKLGETSKTSFSFDNEPKRLTHTHIFNGNN